MHLAFGALAILALAGCPFVQSHSAMAVLLKATWVILP